MTTAVKEERTPNKKQQECIDNIKGKYLVLAGPGTGKTFTIIERIKNMLKELNHKGTFIMAHMGYTFKWDMIIEEFKSYDVYFDLALSLGTLKMYGKDYPLMDEDTLLKFIDTFGSERILFATDCPWMNQKESVDVFNSYKRISEKDRENILYKNALRLLNIKG